MEPRTAWLFTMGTALLVLSSRAMSAQTPALRPPAPSEVRNYQMVKVGEGVYAFIAPDGITPMVNGNSVVIIGDDGVLVLDTGQFPEVIRWEIAQIKSLTRQPVRYIVNSHWHPDHWLGNAEFQKAFPGVAILSAPSTRGLMMTQAGQFIDPKRTAATRDAVKGMLASGKGGDGAPLQAELRLQYQYAVTQLTDMIPFLERTTAVIPGAVFHDSMTVFLGKREVQVKYLGRGNTGGDAVVYVPDTRTLATGDLLVHPYPYAFGSFIGEWIETLRRLGAIDAAAIVPGHGKVEYDKQYLTQVTDLLQSVQSQVGTLVSEGASLADTRAKVDLERFRRQMCVDFLPYCNVGFRVSMAAAIERAWREAKEGKLTDEK